MDSTMNHGSRAATAYQAHMQGGRHKPIISPLSSYWPRYAVSGVKSMSRKTTDVGRMVSLEMRFDAMRKQVRSVCV
jgi:hypothetical protein